MLTPKESLSTFLLKFKPKKSEFERFNRAFENLLKYTTPKYEEEFNKNVISTFLSESFYKESNYININGKIDLVIYSNLDPSSSIEVLIETKRPTESSEMLTRNNINKKALQELLLYFLNERFGNNNITIKRLIATNNIEWFIFDAKLFEELFAEDKELKKDYYSFKSNIALGNNTAFFYNNIAKPAIDKVIDKLDYTYFSLKGKINLREKIAIYKVLSPYFLLKRRSTDINTLNENFYKELLYLIGLEEIKEGSKIIIDRCKIPRRQEASLLESTLYILSDYDVTNTYETALQLVILWINRLLFLKLLESQLVTFNKSNKFYFLNSEKIKDFDGLAELFFRVLAVPIEERDERVSSFNYVPYLNSSLFEMTELEKQFFTISGLMSKKIHFYSKTVLKDNTNKICKGTIDTLSYLFLFLGSYNFGAIDNDEMIQDDKKDLINASVLGLIFEKINGYKDGAYFTPSYITQYICHETISKIIIDKFNISKGWNCNTIDEVESLLEIKDRQEANDIINSIKICDPAVGSGHFLVSALNEIIAIKSYLGILQDKNGKRIKYYNAETDNDELDITDVEDNEMFVYNPNDSKSQQLQETIFNEKRQIIENCLFGVDINPNSVNICRLRLWIELLKNSYYRLSDKCLETLPNIDINIKVGDSILFKYPLEVNSSIESNIDKRTLFGKQVIQYKSLVNEYKHTTNKATKNNLTKQLYAIKKSIRGNFQLELFSEKASKDNETNIYNNSLEWMLEFPEIWDDTGTFLGFDAIVGNPPFISAINLKKHYSPSAYKYLKHVYKTAVGTIDMYVYFFELGLKLLKEGGYLSYITPNRFLSVSYGEALRQHIYNNCDYLEIINYSDKKVFSDASTYPVISIIKNSRNPNKTIIRCGKVKEKNDIVIDSKPSILLNVLDNYIWGPLLNDKIDISLKVIQQSISLLSSAEINATSTASEADEYSKLITQVDGFKLINTGTIDSYSSLWGQKYLTNKGKKYLYPFLPKNSSIISKKRKLLYSSPKIIIAKIGIQCEAFYDEKGEYASINTNCLHSFKNDFRPEYVLSWLNSKLYNYVYECLFDGLRMSGGYLLYSAPNLSQTYIKPISQQDEFANIFKEIKNKLANKEDVTPLIDIIDNLFYDIYGLTNNERQTINDNFSR